MRIRVYSYDGVLTPSVKHASCIATLILPRRAWLRRKRELLDELGGDFYTVNEPIPTPEVEKETQCVS
jgi:hypothetical protein